MLLETYLKQDKLAWKKNGCTFVDLCNWLSSWQSFDLVPIVANHNIMEKAITDPRHKVMAILWSISALIGFIGIWPVHLEQLVQLERLEHISSKSKSLNPSEHRDFKFLNVEIILSLVTYLFFNIYFKIIHRISDFTPIEFRFFTLSLTGSHYASLGKYVYYSLHSIPLKGVSKKYFSRTSKP